MLPLMALVRAIVGISVGLDEVIYTFDNNTFTFVIFLSIFLFLLVLILFVWIIIYFSVLKPKKEYRQIMKTGKHATATILSISETIFSNEDQFIFKLNLQVELPGVPTYTVTVEKGLWEEDVSQFQPGTKVSIMVDANNKMKVVFIRQEDMPQTNPLTNASPQQIVNSVSYIYPQSINLIMKINPVMAIGLVGGIVGISVGLVAIIITGDIFSVVVFGGVTLLVSALIYFIFIKPGIEYSRIMKTGKPATGTILSMSETGTRINNQPLIKFELQVELPGLPAYITTTKKTISYLQVSQFQPGTKVPIMVDAQNNMKVVFIRQGDMAQTNPLTNASPKDIKNLQDKLMEMQKESDLIKATGTYSKAIVTKFTNLGVNVNGKNPLASIEMQVMPDNEPAFSATVKAVFKDTSIPLYQPGEEIFVKYDPMDKTRVAIEHS